MEEQQYCSLIKSYGHVNDWIERLMLLLGLIKNNREQHLVLIKPYIVE